MHKMTTYMKVVQSPLILLLYMYKYVFGECHFSRFYNNNIKGDAFILETLRAT